MTTKKNNTKPIIIGLLLAILLSSMDNTIVATAMGTIVSELGDYSKFIWVTSAYMIASVAGMPIFGKLSDMYGRKRFFISGLVIFLIGSILCGMAQSMVQLSIFRAIQGIGGGALVPITFTIIFDTFPPEKRGQMTALFGATFGISSILGPLLGAYLTDYLDWRWIFYVNVPLGFVSLFLIWRYYFESLEYREQKIDFLGAIFLVISVVSLMFALEFGGNEFTWTSIQIVGLFATTIIFLGLFLWVETKVSDPIITLSLFKNQLFAASQAVTFFYGTVLIVVTMFIPIYIQAVYGGSATNAGLILTPMMLGSVVGSQLGGRLVGKFSYKVVMMFSGALLLLGILLLTTLTADTLRILVTSYMVITGVGIGFSFPVLSMASLHSLDIRQRGTANSTNTFFRMIGMTLGITIYGAIQNNIFINKLKEYIPDMDEYSQMEDTRALLRPEVREQIPPNILETMSGAFAESISSIFTWSMISVALSLVFITIMGKDRFIIPQKKVS